MATISSEQMALYRQTAARLAQQDRNWLAARYEQAQRTADRAAQWLAANIPWTRLWFSVLF